MNDKTRQTMHSSKSDHYTTPQDFYEDLNLEFEFDFDPCPLNADFDGLSIEWGDRNFVNPPYSRVNDWVEYGYEQWKKGKLVVFLTPSRTDTRWFHNYIYHQAEIRFVKGRLRFNGMNVNAPFPSMVAIFRPPSTSKKRGD